MKLVKFKDVFGKYVYVNPNRVENLQENEAYSVKATNIYASNHVCVVEGDLDEIANKLGDIKGETE